MQYNIYNIYVCKSWQRTRRYISCKEKVKRKYIKKKEEIKRENNKKKNLFVRKTTFTCFCVKT